MNNSTKQVIQDLINVIEQNKDEMISGPVDFALDNAKAKLAEPEPVSEEFISPGTSVINNFRSKLPKRKPLSDDEIRNAFPGWVEEDNHELTFLAGARWMERKLNSIGS